MIVFKSIYGKKKKKTLSKLGIVRYFLKLSDSIIFNDERLNCILPRSKTKQEYPFFPPLFSIIVELPTPY